VLSSLPGRVAFPRSTTYESSIASYWSSLESALKPSCIVIPKNTNETATAIKLLSEPRGSACQLAIRGGGHTPWAGSANIEEGITIDMSAMKAISINKDHSLVSIGAGARWGDVYRRTDEWGVAVVGGRGSTIGVGGLTLGGMLTPTCLERHF
jgi:FAD/FMN-containing dehydrogenase